MEKLINKKESANSMFYNPIYAFVKCPFLKAEQSLIRKHLNLFVKIQPRHFQGCYKRRMYKDATNLRGLNFQS